MRVFKGKVIGVTDDKMTVSSMLVNSSIDNDCIGETFSFTLPKQYLLEDETIIGFDLDDIMGLSVFNEADTSIIFVSAPYEDSIFYVNISLNSSGFEITEQKLVKNAE